MSLTDQSSRLLDLPAELVHHILTYLQPFDLTNAAAACRTLHALCAEERLWQAFVNHELPHPTQDCTPSPTFRDLYIAHHPYWFLPRNRIWFADSEPNGKLLLSRYDPERGSIVAHTITATRGVHTIDFWERDREVIIHSFTPKVSLDLNQPVLCLDLDRTSTDNNDFTSGRSKPTRYGEESMMPSLSDTGLFASFMLCRSLPEAAIRSKTQVWPPLRFPSRSRTRNDSADNFSSLGHRPTSLADVSQETFRLHKWVVYSGRGTTPSTISSLASSLSTLGGLAGGLGFNGPSFGNIGTNHRFPESITTYATLPPSSYTPTQEKPWQGIWCGDYSGHGCEFLVITQPDRQDERPLPDSMNWLRDWLRGGRRESLSSSGSFASAFEEIENANRTATFEQDSDVSMDEAMHVTPEPEEAAASTAYHRDVPSGRIEAIKLTGDPNIPRGEFTFIAPDIGHGGFVRVADEEPFRGARVVRSAGHIAGRGFQRG